MPSSRDTYIHRLGRTGRAGKEGKGWLILSPFESKFLKELKGLDVSENQELSELLNHRHSNSTTTMLTSETADETNNNENINNSVMETIVAASNTRNSLLSMRASMAYQSFLGYYHEHLKRSNIKNSQELLLLADSMFASQVGLKNKNMPKISSRLASKLHLAGIPGVRLMEDEES
jgi:ATP-dependent RNA helicase MSS116